MDNIEEFMFLPFQIHIKKIIRNQMYVSVGESIRLQV